MRVRTHGTVLAILFLALTIQLGGDSSAYAQGFLGAASGVRATGMGGAGSVVDDPWAGTVNPGALAPNMMGINVLTAHTDGDMTFDRLNRNTLVAFALPTARLGRTQESLGLSMAYASRDQEGGIRNINVSENTTMDYIDDAEYHTLSLALDYGFQFGAGVTQFHYYNSFTRELSTGRDYGLMVRVPLFRILSLINQSEHRPQIGKFTPEFTVTGGYTWSNRNQGGAPLPNYYIFGLSAAASLRYKQFELVHVTFSRDLTEWKRRHTITERMGWEFGYFDILDLRLGSSARSVNKSVYGMAVHSKGIAKLVFAFAKGFDHERLPWYATGVDLYYEYAHNEWGGDSSYDEFGLAIDAVSLFSR